MQVSGQTVCAALPCGRSRKERRRKSTWGMWRAHPAPCVCCTASQTVWGADLGHQHQFAARVVSTALMKPCWPCYLYTISDMAVKYLKGSMVNFAKQVLGAVAKLDKYRESPDHSDGKHSAFAGMEPTMRPTSKRKASTNCSKLWFGCMHSNKHANVSIIHSHKPTSQIE